MAAIHKVRSLLVAKAESLELTALTDRDESTPVGLDDADCVLIQEDGAQIEFLEGHSGGTITHTGTFLLTFLARGEGAETARSRAYAMLVLMANALLDDHSLGGQVQQVRPISYGGEVPAGNDVEGIGLDLEIDFCTPNNDFDTLI